MSYPALVIYGTESDYKDHFREKYCQKVLATFDGITVGFTHSDFKHAFYQASGNQRKGAFSKDRARRIDWIEAALGDQTAQLHCGWHAVRKQVDTTRRVALVQNNYVVVIQLLSKSNKARFVTAYAASRSTVQRIKNSRKWSCSEEGDEPDTPDKHEKDR